MKVVSLCSDCKKCPEVRVDGDRIEIGEEGNLCVLNAAEWAELKDKVLAGEL